MIFRPEVCVCTTLHVTNTTLKEINWPNRESARLPPMGPKLESWSCSQKWVEFFHPHLRCSSIYKTLLNSNSIWTEWASNLFVDYATANSLSFILCIYSFKEARKGFSLHAHAQSTPRCTRQLNESK